MASGATVNVGANVTVLLRRPDDHRQRDAELRHRRRRDFNTYYGASQIVVGGTMTATSDTFPPRGTTPRSRSTPAASSRRPAAPSTSLSSRRQHQHYASGDLTGDTFNMPIYVPYNDVQYLAGNRSFSDVDINADTSPAVRSSLNRIGTNTVEPALRLPGRLHGGVGAALDVGADVTVLLAGQTLTDNGTLTFATGDTMTSTPPARRRSSSTGR